MDAVVNPPQLNEPSYHLFQKVIENPLLPINDSETTNTRTVKHATYDLSEQSEQWIVHYSTALPYLTFIYC